MGCTASAGVLASRERCLTLWFYYAVKEAGRGGGLVLMGYINNDS